jgi:phosphoribosylglycinamide formyltransferase-1
MTGKPLSLAVLISGTGSNLKALIDAMQAGRLDISIDHVISNKAQAGGLNHARQAGIPFSVFDAEGTGVGEPLDRAIGARLRQVEPDLVVLAGYMRILGPALVRQFAGEMINLHPSLLPKYPGLDTYRRCLANGDREHGSSMHFITEGLDDGPLITQVRIPVLTDDTPATLAARLGPEEHRLIVATVELFTRHAVEMAGSDVLVDGKKLPRPLELQKDETLV